MAVNNSSYTLQDVADIISANGDTAPALATGGFSQQPMIQMANKVLAAMLNGGAQGQPMGWKWNRLLVTPFPTISWQQDYFIAGLVNLSWLESAWGICFTNTSQPKPKIPLEVHKDLLVTYQQCGYPGKVCWVQASQAQTGTWGDTELQTPTGQNNPGPGVLYVNPLTVLTQPSNASTAIEDPNGGLWALTTYGTCGTFNPFALNITATSITGNVLTVTCPNSVQIGQSVLLQGTAEPFLNGQSVTVASVIGASPNQTGFTAAFVNANYSNPADTGTVFINQTYPTLTSPNIVATTVIDGTVVWTAINPNGQAIRLNPIPPQQGQVWTINCVGQLRITQFTTLTQSLGVLPDDYYQTFVDGCMSEAYRRNPDAKIRARFKDEWTIWLKSLKESFDFANKEMDDFGFYPSEPIMETGAGSIWLGPAAPYPGWPWYY
jgi:hypothetical protein